MKKCLISKQKQPKECMTKHNSFKMVTISLKEMKVRLVEKSVKVMNLFFIQLCLKLASGSSFYHCMQNTEEKQQKFNF